MTPFLRALLVLVVAGGLLLAALTYVVVRRGLGTDQPPSAVETLAARTMRRLATPRSVRDASNPVADSPEVFEAALEHFADHCAVCHGNNGGGDTAIGRRLYPRAPDMRLPATQELSDGELFSIIENGIRLTGMPGWSTGTPEGTRASWTLVHFIRRLPSLTDADIIRMESFNPKTADEWRREEEIRRFLSGEDRGPAPPAPHRHDGPGR